MNFLPLSLTASDINWRLFLLRRSDKKFQTIQEKIFARDQFRCRYCGFTSQKFLDVVNHDGNYQQNNMNNLVTACSFCSQCHFIESIGQSDFGGGVLVYLPELTQNELNASCHVIFASLAMKTSLATNLGNLYRAMKLTSQSVEKELGDGMSQPATVGRVLIDTPKKESEKIEKILKEKIRLLPNLQRFDRAIWTWAVEALAELRGINSAS